MIYLKNTTAAQEVRIPHTGLEVDGRANFSLFNLLNGEVYGFGSATLVAGAAYLTFRVELENESTPNGNYRYEVFQIISGKRVVIAEGLAFVGVQSHIPEPDAATTGEIDDLTFRQYGERPEE